MKYSPDKMYREIVVKIMEVKAAEINPLLNQWHGNYIIMYFSVDNTLYHKGVIKIPKAAT